MRRIAVLALLGLLTTLFSPGPAGASIPPANVSITLGETKVHTITHDGVTTDIKSGVTFPLTPLDFSKPEDRLTYLKDLSPYFSREDEGTLQDLDEEMAFMKLLDPVGYEIAKGFFLEEFNNELLANYNVPEYLTEDSNFDTYLKYGTIAWGEPSEVSAEGFPRYLGKSWEANEWMLANDIPNVYHAYDWDAPFKLHDVEWLEWHTDIVRAKHKDQRFDHYYDDLRNSPDPAAAEEVNDLRQRILDGTDAFDWENVFDPDQWKGEDGGKDILDYAHIFHPPTRTAWGHAVMYREEGGNVYYKTLMIKPLANAEVVWPLGPNLAVEEMTPPAPEPDTPFAITATVTAENITELRCQDSCQVTESTAPVATTLTRELFRVGEDGAWSWLPGPVASEPVILTPGTVHRDTAALPGLPAGTYAYRLTVNRDRVQPPEERAWEDNSKNITFTVRVSSIDLVAADIITDMAEADPGGAVTGSALFRLDGEAPAGNVEYRMTFNGNTFADGVLDFAAGESRYVPFAATAPESGDSQICIYINESHNPPEELPGGGDAYYNNSLCKAIPTRPSPSACAPAADETDEITIRSFRPQSHIDRSPHYWERKQNPPCTAKWTDTVEVTLEPHDIVWHLSSGQTADRSRFIAPPDPPARQECCSSETYITDWRITNARVIYPRKNSDFTFGNPLPPWGTVTQDMTVDGQRAVADFVENWATNGAKRYNILTEQFVDETPQQYEIQVEYDVQVTYTLVRRSYYCIPCCCDEDGCSCCCCGCDTETTEGLTADYHYAKMARVLVDGIDAIPTP